jgi:hypothetical protein
MIMGQRTSLLGGAALGAIAVLGAALPAHAATSSDKEEIGLLRQQLQAVTARLDALQAATDRASADAEQARATAQMAQAMTYAKPETIPSQVKTALAEVPKPKPGWWENTSVSGRMYYDITNIEQKSDGVAVPGGPNGTNFDIKRFYVSIDHKFNDVFSADVTTDFTYDSGPAQATQLYLKKAYLQAKLSDALTLRLGAADLPWVPFVEDLYGYRYIENVVVDRTKFGTSADWGVHALGSFPAGPAKVSYAVSAVNGAGYKKPGVGTANRSESIDLEGRLSARAGAFTVAVGGYTGKLGKDVEGVATFNTARRFDAVAAYTDDRIRLGVEYFHASDWNDVLQSTPALTNTSDGYSVFGSFRFTPKVSVFGRYDWVRPKGDTNADLDDNYFNAGIAYSPAKIVDFALVYKRDKVDNGFISTSNGTIGGLDEGTYDELGLWSQFRW